MSYMFCVRQRQSASGRPFDVWWRLPEVESLADFVRFGAKWRATYEIKKSTKRFAWVELVATSGTAGEFTCGLYWVEPGDRWVTIRYFTRTHELVRHGMDGLPAAFVAQLPRDVPLIEVRALEGRLVMTLADWEAYLLSGRDSKDLLDLGHCTHEEVPGD